MAIVERKEVESEDLVISLSMFVPGSKPSQEKIVIKGVKGRVMHSQLKPAFVLETIEKGLENVFGRFK